MTTEAEAINFERLFKLRLAVARHGEMDAAGWWNTRGVLGRRGATVLKRGFPSTHRFAQARVVFEVARSRCREVFDPPGCMTLWHLPAEIEDEFEEHWQSWLDDSEAWESLFERIEAHNGTDLLKDLADLELLSQQHSEAVSRLRRSAENRAVPLAGTFRPSDDVITLMAAGFARGEPGNPAIPYARLEA